MKELIIGKNDAGKRLDRFVGGAVPLLPDSLRRVQTPFHDHD